jgi:hypothetical protein
MKAALALLLATLALVSTTQALYIDASQLVADSIGSELFVPPSYSNNSARRPRPVRCHPRPPPPVGAPGARGQDLQPCGENAASQAAFSHAGAHSRPLSAAAADPYPASHCPACRPCQ